MLTECLEAGMNTRELDSRANYLRGHRCSKMVSGMTSWKRWCRGATKAEELQHRCKCSGQWGDHVETRKKDQTGVGGAGGGHGPWGPE